jgi:hypothetical protein
MRVLILFTLAFMSGMLPATLFAAKTKLSPELEAAQIAKTLKPISDSEWNITAGSKTTERYSIIRGDTLYGISKHLFGDSKYWPKIWALNNNKITNPHKIRPGNEIAFSTGSGSDLPSVSINSDQSSSRITERTTDAPFHSPIQTAKKRSMEWRDLPPQPWEKYQVILPPEIDPQGFDQRSKITFPRNSGFETFTIPASQKLHYLGQIIGSRTESDLLSLADMAYIRADDSIQVGTTYAITQEPYILKSKHSERVGYSYPILGKVKILSVRDGLFIGRIIAAKDGIPRGSSLITLPEKVPELTPIPALKPIPGILIFDHNYSTYTTAQHKEVFIDRGSQDEVQPGMIFRAYQHYDPGTDKRLTKSNFIIDADVMVTRVSESFSLGVVLRSHSPIVEDSKVTLLTDVSDVNKSPEYRIGNEKDDELENLDRLDDQESLGENERKELKQLENWKNNPEPSPSETIPPSNPSSIEAPPSQATIPPLPSENGSEPSSAETPDSEIPPPPPPLPSDSGQESSPPSEPPPPQTEESPLPPVEGTLSPEPSDAELSSTPPQTAEPSAHTSPHSNE